MLTTPCGIHVWFRCVIESNKAVQLAGSGTATKSTYPGLLQLDWDLKLVLSLRSE